MKERIVGFDAIKSVSIYLVVLVHYSFYVPLIKDTPLANFIIILSNIGVPLFLAVNGALLFSKSLDVKRHYAKTARIVLITLVWRALSAWIMSLIVSQNPLERGMRAFLDYVLFGDLEGFMLGHFWFMNALIALYLLYPVIRICLDTLQGVFVVECLLGIVLLLTFVPNILDILVSVMSFYLGIPSFSFATVAQRINPFGSFGYVLVYFVGGGLLRQARNTPDSTDLSARISSAASYKLVMTFFASWILLFLVQRFQRASLGPSFAVEGGYWNIATLLMTVSLFELFSRMRFNRPQFSRALRIIGDNTLGIYFTHMFALMALGQLADMLPAQLPLAINLLCVLLVCLACLLVSCSFRKVPLVRTLFNL
ncbi:acyltransferase [Thermophilibacter provencensis]|uniref:acyltransferase n=1 Tax=Thermophilibacter provencensis TaxID=1852386 RepID=UPI00294316F2|nr:acyltransferase [Thermophilibacter provencensis]